MRSPQTIGDDHARPGIFVFQTTFSVALHLSGRPEPSLTPEDPGPRNCGQFSAADARGPTTRGRQCTMPPRTKIFVGAFDDTLILSPSY